MEKCKCQSKTWMQWCRLMNYTASPKIIWNNLNRALYFVMTLDQLAIWSAHKSFQINLGRLLYFTHKPDYFIWLFFFLGTCQRVLYIFTSLVHAVYSVHGTCSVQCTRFIQRTVYTVHTAFTVKTSAAHYFSWTISL